VPKGARRVFLVVGRGASGYEHAMAALILIVDDEVDIAQTLAYGLEKEGFESRVAHTGRDGLAAARKAPRPDLLLLDLMLPDMGGLDVCRELKRAEDTRHLPIIMLTARGEEIDRVVGFEVGADDYVVKPFSTRELVLRAKAVLRRKATREGEGEGETRFGRLRIDTQAHKAWVDGEERALTSLELRLLETLLARRGRVQSREALLADVWGITADVTTRTVDTHVKRLREKLGGAGAYIETVRGTGYRFTAQVKDEA
jgi:two-component system, OmpR family, phosphate regulon response regulator PhoB